MYKKLEEHIGHSLEVVQTGDFTLSLRCTDCDKTVFSRDKLGKDIYMDAKTRADAIELARKMEKFAEEEESDMTAEEEEAIQNLTLDE